MSALTNPRLLTSEQINLDELTEDRIRDLIDELDETRYQLKKRLEEILR